MTLRIVPRLLFLALALLGSLALTSLSGAATRTLSAQQAQRAVKAWIPPASVVTDVSSENDVRQAVRRLVLEYRPEERGGASAISSATYDPANPLPVYGFTAQVSREPGAIRYSLVAVSQSQPRFYLRGSLVNGARQNQLLNLRLGPLSEDDPEFANWALQLRLSDDAWPLPADSFLSPASVNQPVQMIRSLHSDWTAYRTCDRVPFVHKMCVKYLRLASERDLLEYLPDNKAGLAYSAMSNACQWTTLRKAWREATGSRRTPIIVSRIWKIIHTCN